jgi:hypothetical protein
VAPEVDHESDALDVIEIVRRDVAARLALATSLARAVELAQQATAELNDTGQEP